MVRSRGSARWIGFGAALSLAIGASCSREGGAEGGETRRAARERPLNVAIVVLDTLRPDRLACYGSPRVTSPRLDLLARESVVFENAQSAAPLTVASLLSLATSLYPDVHGIQGSENPGRMSENVTTLAEMLRARGYATAAFTEGGWAKGEFGLDQGFDHYPKNEGDDESNFSNLKFPSRIAGNVDRTIEWLEKERRGPFFLFFHTYEVHSPYYTREEYVRMFRPGFDERADHERVRAFIERWNEERTASREDCLALLMHWYQCPLTDLPALEAPEELEAVSARHGCGPDDVAKLEPVVTLVKDLYDASIRYADHELERLWNAFDELDLSDDTVLVVVSDHGEGLGQHGEIEHGNVLAEEALRVLLMLRAPKGELAPARVASQVRTVDVVPTLLDLLDVHPANAFFQGESLLPLVRRELADEMRVDASDAERARRDRPSFSHARRIAAGQNPQYSIKSGRWRLVVEPMRGARWLHDLASDPFELADVAASHPDVVKELEAALQRQTEQDRRLKDVLASKPQAIEIDAATLRELRALGYAGDLANRAGGASSDEE